MGETAAPQAAGTGGKDTTKAQPAGEASGKPRVTFRRKLFVLRQNWGSAYAIAAGDEPGTAWATRRDGLGEPMQGTPGEVARLIAADYGRQPVPRDVAP